MRARCSVSAWVVVPAETAMAIPGCTSSAAAAAIASFSRRRCTDFAAKPGSDDDGSATASAPPWTFSSRPVAVQRHEVAPDGHVGDAQQLDEVGDAHRPVAAELGEDPPPSLGREHQAPRAASTASRTTATPSGGHRPGRRRRRAR